MNNLTPEQMAWLQQQQNAVALKSNSGWSPNYQPNGWSPGFDPNGDFWTGGFTGGSNGGEASYGQQASPTNYFRDVVPGQHNIGDKQDQFDTSGQYQGTYAIPKPDAIAEKYLPLALLAFGGAAGMGMLGGGGAAGSGLGAAVDPMMYGGTGAGTWGAGEAAAGAGGAGAAAAGGGAGAGSGGLTMGSELFPATGVTGGSAGLGLEGLAPIGSAAAGIGGALGKYGGLLAAGLGALGGSQGVKQSTTSDKSPWAPMIPFLMNDQGSGLFNRAQGLLDRSFSPDQMTQNDWMRQHAVGLLMPQQQNNFSRFFPGQ